MEKFLTGLFGLLGVLALVSLFAVIMAFPVMWMWNYTMPPVFGLPEISVWQALWGSLLMRFIFGTSTSNG